MCVDVERPLVEAGLEVDFYDKAVPEPPMSTIEEIVRIVENGGYDIIVGFGGGSPIDVAKAAAVLPHTGDTVYDYVGIDQVPAQGPADHRHPHHHRHRLRVHGDRHLRRTRSST